MNVKSLFCAKRFFVLLTFLAVLLIAVVSTNATPLFFTDESSFQSAVSSASLSLAVESFEGLSLWSTAPLTVGNLTVSNLGGSYVSVFNQGVTDGTQSIVWDQSGRGDITWTFSTSINAFGIDIVGLGWPFPSTTLTLTTDTGSQALFTDFSATTNVLLFGGVIDTVTPFTTVSLSSSNESDAIVFDRLQTAPVPEPSTMLLMVSGLIGLAAFRKKFKKR